jgi:hypothetical protein
MLFTVTPEINPDMLFTDKPGQSGSPAAGTDNSYFFSSSH